MRHFWACITWLEACGAIDLAVMHGYAFAASATQRYFQDAGAIKKQNRFFSGVLVAVGMALFFVKRNPQA